jgi:hypothetical protein
MNYRVPIAIPTGLAWLAPDAIPREIPSPASLPHLLRRSRDSSQDIHNTLQPVLHDWKARVG